MYVAIAYLLLAAFAVSGLLNILKRRAYISKIQFPDYDYE